MTNVDPLTFPQEIVPTFNGDGKTKAQTQKDSFTAAKIFFQDSRGWPTSFENGMVGTVAVILCQPTRPFKKKSMGIAPPATPTTSAVALFPARSINHCKSVT